MVNKKRDLTEKTVLKTLKGRQTKQVGISMPISLIERFEEVKNEVESQGYTLVLSEICCEAIEDAIERAGKEMAAILKKQAAQKT